MHINSPIFINFLSLQGKTFLAKSIAGEAKDTTFLEVKMSNILSCYQGTSEQNLTAVFDIAEMMAPSIIFIGKYYGPVLKQYLFSI